ncbi:MAG: aspartate carbamoyltransferase catalytic subunit [Glaciecola sp.]|jgi:aspartate carbamoyltransferase catalytic subunit
MKSLRHLLSTEDLDAQQITGILDTAERFAELTDQPIKKVPTLRGYTICNLFLEDSTRTRISFDVAAKRLSADVITFTGKGSSVSKGESFRDTALTLKAMGVDAIVVRSHSSGAPQQLASYIDVPVLNAGDGWHQHPTQGLLDLFTIRQHAGRIQGLNVAVVGDILHSRVARSEVQGLVTMGANVTVVAPPTLLPPGVEDWNVRVCERLDDVLGELDVIYLLRVQRERMNGGFFPSSREYARVWGMNAARLAQCKPEVLIMHPGPMNRGVEVTSEVADHPRAVITDQVTNGISVRMACLYLLLANDSEVDHG